MLQSPAIATPPLLPIVEAPLWTRLSVVEFEETALVMDRGNGRWAMIRTADLPLLQLLSSDSADLPAAIAARCRQLIGQLRSAGLGEPESTQHNLSTLILKLTNACNFACTYCYDYEPEERAMRMDLDLASSAVEQALLLAPRGLHVILHGGEPTLAFPLLREVVLRGEEVAVLTGKRIVFSGQTNLSQLSDEMVSFFEQHHVTWGISLDGPPEFNDRFRVLRNGAGTYDILRRALERYPAFVLRCGTMTTVTSATEEHLLAIARHVRDLGFQCWDWSLFQPIGRGRTHAGALAFHTESAVASWNRLFDSIEQGEFDGFDVQPVTKYLNNFLDGPGRNMCLRKGCGAARELLSLSADGAVEACDCIDPAGPMSGLGDLRKESLAAAQASAIADSIRSRDVEQGRCGTCAWLAVCGGTCLAHAGSVEALWEPQCAVAMNAFGRIAASLAAGDTLHRYRDSLRAPARRV